MNADDIMVQSYTAQQLNSANRKDFDLIPVSSYIPRPYLYSRLLRMAHDLNPYLHEYFKVYQPNQKLVILKMFQNLGFYDEALFTNFTS